MVSADSAAGLEEGAGRSVEVREPRGRHGSDLGGGGWLRRPREVPGEVGPRLAAGLADRQESGRIDPDVMDTAPGVLLAVLRECPPGVAQVDSRLAVNSVMTDHDEGPGG